METDVLEAELHSPCGMHRYRVHDGIANMVVDLARQEMAVGGAAASASSGAMPWREVAPGGAELPAHRMYRRREQREVCVMQGKPEFGPESLQVEAASIAGSVHALLSAWQSARIRGDELLGGLLLTYLQSRHPKSWLCGESRVSSICTYPALYLGTIRHICTVSYLTGKFVYTHWTHAGAGQRNGQNAHRLASASASDSKAPNNCAEAAGDPM
jgi:hypothetical protein